MKESEIQKRVHLAASKAGYKLFRNNVGKSWVGKEIRPTANQSIHTPSGFYIIKPGDILLSCPRRFHSGLCDGSSDLIGWKSITVTEDMVGTQLAVFCGLEIKTQQGKASEAQLNFIEQVKKAGGIASVVRSELDI